MYILLTRSFVAVRLLLPKTELGNGKSYILGCSSVYCSVLFDITFNVWYSCRQNWVAEVASLEVMVQGLRQRMHANLRHLQGRQEPLVEADTSNAIQPPSNTVSRTSSLMIPLSERMTSIEEVEAFERQLDDIRGAFQTWYSARILKWLLAACSNCVMELIALCTHAYTHHWSLLSDLPTCSNFCVFSERHPAYQGHPVSMKFQNDKKQFWIKMLPCHMHDVMERRLSLGVLSLKAGLYCMTARTELLELKYSILTHRVTFHSLDFLSMLLWSKWVISTQIVVDLKLAVSLLELNGANV